jgi:phosphocarrier protein
VSGDDRQGTLRREIAIVNRLGLHGRAASLLVQTLQPFTATVTVYKDDQCVNGKSIIQLLTLAAGQGTVLVVDAEGPDAEAALSALEDLARARFHEAE